MIKMYEIGVDNTARIERLAQEVYESLVSDEPLPGQSYLATLVNDRKQNPENSEQSRCRHLLASHTAHIVAALLHGRQQGRNSE